MKTRLPLLICSLAFCAAAQTLEFGVSGGYPYLRRNNLGSDSLEDAQDTDTTMRGEYSYGATFTINTKGYYGHELGYTFSRVKLTSIFRSTPTDSTTQVVTTASTRIPVHMGHYNFLIYFMPRNERWRPFVTGGLQLYHYGNPHFPDWDAGGSRNYGANWGGGLKIRLFKYSLVRLDIRDYIGGTPYNLTFKDPTAGVGHMHQWQGSFGLSITF